jgi:pimeloyl-ACP methyl ester carboxylesterase
MEIACIGDINICYQTFGHESYPAVLLLGGGCSQSILWPVKFCEQLVAKGFYVIRFDYRDTGLSSCVDYKSRPYTLQDLSEDSVLLLKFLKIKKVQLFGHSMGGNIAQIMAWYYPELVQGITLYATTCDMRPANLAFASLPAELEALPGPSAIYMNWMRQFIKFPPKKDEEHLDFRLAGWRILNGDKVPFEEDLYREIHRSFLQRTQNIEALGNHVLACRASEGMIRNAPYNITSPTIVIHGTEDPILPLEHGEALAKRIPDAKFILANGMGHIPNCQFYELMVQAVVDNS